MQYKLLVCDFDGTLYTDDFKVSQQTIDAVQEFKNNGGKFVIATGRLYQAIKPFAKLFDLTDEIITYQGSGVYDLKSDQLLMSKEINCDLSVEVYEYLYKNYSDITSPMLFYDDKCIVEEQNAYNQYFASIVKVPLVCVGQRLDTYVKEQNINARKILSLTINEHIRGVISDLQQRFGDKLNINQSSKGLLECVNKQASKGNAVQWIAQRYGIKREEVCAIGDSENDNSMLIYAGLGVAMGNAMSETIAVADMVCDTNNNDGVSKVIREVLLKS